MDGALSWMASVACPVAGARPYRVLPHPTENRFFGAQNNGGGIIEGPYDPVLGTLSLGPPAPGLSLATLASKPDGQYLYSSDGPTIGIWSTAPGLSSSGSYTMPDVVTELEMHPSGAYLFAATGGTSNRVFSLAIDSAGNLSGIGTPVVLGPSARCGGMALSQDGNFLVLAVDDGSATGWVQVVGVSPTGTLSPVGSWEAWTSDSARKPQDVAVAPDGTLLVASAGVTTTEPGSLRPFTLDGAGVLTPTGQIQLTGSNPVRVIVVVK